jgi:hypothetical protein
MTNAGYIIIQRCLLNDPLLRDDAYFRAWLWLVSEAAWKISRVKITNGRTSEIIELERGQLSQSRSYMANSWGWSEKRVRTFLRRLEKGGMIDVQAGRLQTVITICNYDIYQGAPDDEGRRTGQQTGRQRADKGPEEEYIKEENNIIETALSRRPRTQRVGRRAASSGGMRATLGRKTAAPRRRHMPKLGRGA